MPVNTSVVIAWKDRICRNGEDSLVYNRTDRSITMNKKIDYEVNLIKGRRNKLTTHMWFGSNFYDGFYLMLVSVTAMIL